MERALRVNLLRRNQLLKATIRKDKKQMKRDWWAYDRQIVEARRMEKKYIVAERKNRREDWMCGPLAPRRDVGNVRGAYGTIDKVLARQAVLPVQKQTPEKRRLFAPGDRVVAIRGRDKGRIGKIDIIEWESNCAVVEGLNMADFEIPRYAEGSERSSSKITPREVPINLNDLRLVYKMSDPDKPYNPPRDTVIKHMYAGDIEFEREPNSSIPKHNRFVSGLDLELEWPHEDIPSLELTDDDTARRTVDDYSDSYNRYMPSVIRGEPLPEGVIDELQSRKARGRGRFELGYMKERIVQDAYDKWVKGRKMLTPMQEAAEAEMRRRREATEAERTRRRETEWMGRKRKQFKLSEETTGLIKEVQALTLKEKRGRKAGASAGGGGGDGIVVDVGLSPSQPEVRL